MELLTVDDVAQLLKIKPRGVHRLCREGQLDYVELSCKERRFKPEHVEAYIENRTVRWSAPKKIDSSRTVRVASPKHVDSRGGDTSSTTEELDAKALKKEMRRWH